MEIGPETERLFHELVDLSAVARDRYYEEHGVPPEVRSDVESLLHNDAPQQDRLTRVVEGSAARLLSERRPDACGPYRLLHMLGHGGMGSVYLAERADGEIEQRVAIKFLRYGGGEAVFHNRFLRERQILATLNHPGIAQLLDAGHALNGEPYLVMEYIDGTPIDVFSEKIEVRARLELLVQVCEAVSYAHQNLVIHRDLKPSNILVDSSGRPKLLDFGVAKLLEAEEGPAAATMLTREWGAIMTPEYAAPEQVSDGPVTTAIDVYALGVLLYVLMTGQHPFGASRHSSAQLLKAITEAEPLRPSDAARKTSASLQRQLRGDLDTIVAKALKKDPRERYSSVAAFAEDLQRYLRHEPIAARPDTFVYRAAKFARRNRAAVALGAFAIAALLAGVAGTWTQARTARLQRDFALRELSRAEAVNDLNAFVLSDAAPSGKPFTVDDLLRRAERIVQRQARDDARRADLLVEIGRQYTVTDEYADARRLLQQAYGLSRRLTDPSVRAQASCGLAQVLSRLGDFSRAEQLLKEGLSALPDQPIYALDRIDCLERASEVAQNRGAAGEGLARAQQARALLKQVPIPSELTELNTLITLAGAYSNAGRYFEATTEFQKAARVLAALGRDRTQRAATVYNNWGVALILAGQPVEAEKVFRQVIDISRADASDDTVPAMSLVNYALVLTELGRVNEAAGYAERGYAKARQSGDETALIQALSRRASIYRKQGDLRQSEAMLAEVEPRLRRRLPPGHIAFAILASERALNALAAGDSSLALKHANESVAIAEALVQSHRQGADRLPVFLSRRSAIELDSGMTENALADAKRAVAELQKNGLAGAFSTMQGRAYLALGRALLAHKQPAEAHTALQSAAENLESALGRDNAEARAARQLAGAGR